MSIPNEAEPGGLDVLPILGAEPPPRPPAVTPEQMQEVDRIMMEDLKVHRLQMVENAGRLLATLAGSMCEGLTAKRFIIMAGKGGNGAGGLIAARYIHNWGGLPEVITLGGSEFTDPLLHTLRELGVPIRPSPDEVELNEVVCIIDALMGIGASGPPRAEVGELIRWANEAEGIPPLDLSMELELDEKVKIPILSLDIPSGLDALTGQLYDPCIRAVNTLTVALPKVGLYEPGATEATGFLYLGDVGIPIDVFARIGVTIRHLFLRSDFIHIS